MPGPELPRYWDASAIIAALFEDERALRARQLNRVADLSFMSSLAYAETVAVTSRRHVTAAQAAEARDVLHRAWRWSEIIPEAGNLRSLASQYSLRGADLWHLAAARELRSVFPTLRIVTYDNALAAAASAEGFVVDQ